MLLELRQIVVKPGQQLLLQDINWQEFESILTDLGKNRSARVSYSRGILEIMVPLPEHEWKKKILGGLVETLLDELGITFWPLGSVTIKQQKMAAGVEPDECYYIRNEAVVRGRSRLEFEIDPPPDLAIEIDITSRTSFDNYAMLGVPELWKYNGAELNISVLQQGRYVSVPRSTIVPAVDVCTLLPMLLNLAAKEGRAAAIARLKTALRQQ